VAKNQKYYSGEHYNISIFIHDVLTMLIVAIPLIITAFVLIRKVKPEEVAGESNFKN
jgi:hypothetical protein